MFGLGGLFGQQQAGMQQPGGLFSPQTSQFEVQKLTAQVLELQRELAVRDHVINGLKVALDAKAEKLDESLISKMIRLCHPDKHGNSKAANEVTQWLLGQRK